MKKRNRDIEFLFEIGTLRHVERSWIQFLRGNVSTISEHIFRVMWIALIIAKHEGVKDTGKIVKMALVHDITESRTGDAHYISRQYVKRDEDLAITDMMEGTAVEDEFIELWREHEKKLSIEAQIVKDADNLEVDFDLREQPFEDEKRRAGWQPVRTQAVYDRLYTKTAKKMWKAIQSSNPHDWHRLGRNRFNAGDWSKKTSPTSKRKRK